MAITECRGHRPEGSWQPGASSDERTHLNRLWRSKDPVSCLLFYIDHIIYSCSHLFSIVQLYCVITIHNAVHWITPSPTTTQSCLVTLCTELKHWRANDAWAGIETRRLGGKSEWTHQCCFSTKVINYMQETAATCCVTNRADMVMYLALQPLNASKPRRGILANGCKCPCGCQRCGCFVAMKVLNVSSSRPSTRNWLCEFWGEKGPKDPSAQEKLDDL